VIHASIMSSPPKQMLVVKTRWARPGLTLQY
jgi:hypothetical protein